VKKGQKSQIRSKSAEPRCSGIDDFIACLRLKNLAPRTIREYERTLRRIFRALRPEIESPREVTIAHLRPYVASLQERGLAPKTVSFDVMVIKGFYGFVFDEG